MPKESKLCFNRINPNRSIPTAQYRLSLKLMLISFNRINPNRSIPTKSISRQQLLTLRLVSIVSIQTDQSRQWLDILFQEKLLGFNRINPNRSIPTLKKAGQLLHHTTFQSYQSKQINPDPEESRTTSSSYDVSIVSIQTDQSRLWIIIPSSL